MPGVSPANKNTLETVQYGVEGSTTFLECQARSPHMSLKWHLLKENSDRRKEVSRLKRGTKYVDCIFWIICRGFLWL